MGAYVNPRAGGGGDGGDFIISNISMFFLLCRRRKNSIETMRISTNADEAIVAATIVPVGTLCLDCCIGVVEFDSAVGEDGGRIGMMFAPVVEFQFIW